MGDGPAGLELAGPGVLCAPELIDGWLPYGVSTRYVAVLPPVGFGLVGKTSNVVVVDPT